MHKYNVSVTNKHIQCMGECKMKKRLFSLLLATTMTASLLAGCGSKSESTTTTDTTAQTEETAEDTAAPAAEETAETAEPVTLTIYAQYADDDTKIPYDYAVEKLKEAYPNVTLELIVQAQDDNMTLNTMAASNNLPDIFQANTDIINSFRETGQIMDVTEVAKSTGFEDKVFESCKDLLYSDDGKIYVFPYAGQEYVLWYYNKALFQQYNLEVPTTYEELLNCIKVFNDNDILPMALFGQEGWISSAMYDAIATRYFAGGIKDLDNGSKGINDAGYADAAKMMNELVNAGMFSADVTNTNYDQASALFLEGKAAMFLNGQWYIPDATTKLGDDVDWMFYPAADAASYEAGKSVFSGGGSTSGYAVNPNGEHAALAAEVAEFIAEKYCESKILNGKVFVSMETGLQPESELAPMMQKLSDTIPSITSMTKFTWGLTNSTFKTGIEDQTRFLLSPQYSADEFIQEMDGVISRMNE
ncbi:MAG: raffinose/stachyose/melibiose transport system substrate-binding protein [Clostridiales bacterium]|nr:raffinose/stachyose/melibiose transport system substrate-binding protein [Clostridiales bacterium]